ncbi:MAG: hypothetical protein HYY17_05790 [Planctomycetes bacterium]|nr:hypothetical protein [Planctomycetota bacterium]
MTIPFHAGRIRALLFFLVALDVVLGSCALASPETWFRLFHGRAYADPAGLMRRAGAIWAAFALLETLALLRWKKEPWWLVLVAGMRLSEFFADWVHLAMAERVTLWGGVGLAVSPVFNACAGWFLIRAYRGTERR